MVSTIPSDAGASRTADPMTDRPQHRNGPIPLFRRHTAVIKRAFHDVCTEELQQLELILKKIGKRAESLAEKKGHT